MINTHKITFISLYNFFVWMAPPYGATEVTATIERGCSKPSSVSVENTSLSSESGFLIAIGLPRQTVGGSTIITSDSEKHVPSDSDEYPPKYAQEGYCFKKGHSRSKAYGNSSQSTPKRPKLDQSMRKQRLDELQEDIKMLTQRISLKEKRCIQAEAARNYKLCDELSEQMSELKAHKREKEKEHVIILRKEKRSLKYVAKVRSTAPALSVTSPPGANITSSVSSRSSLSPSPFSPQSRSSSVSATFSRAKSNSSPR